MLNECIQCLVEQTYEGPITIWVVDDKSTDNTKGLVDRWAGKTAASGSFDPRRRLGYLEGPGYSNFRPGAIHKSFFDHCLRVKDDYVAYQFSDDYCQLNRVHEQVMGMEESDAKWSFCGTTNFVNEHRSKKRQVSHSFSREMQMRPSKGPTLPVYGFMVHRQSFIDAGGCEEPERCGRSAEAWIVAHCGLMGDPHVANTIMFFREHPTNLGATGRAGQALYKRATAVTGMTEDDHHALWDQIAPVYNERVNRARRLHV